MSFLTTVAEVFRDLMSLKKEGYLATLNKEL